MSYVAPDVPSEKMTINAFLDWLRENSDERAYELVNGYVVPKYAQFRQGVLVAMAGGTALHARTKKRALLAFERALSGQDANCEVFPDGFGVEISDDDYRLPDMSVVCGDTDDDALRTAEPTILVEVVSETSRHRDLVKKFAEYSSLKSLQHYLVVIPEDRRIVHFERMENGDFQTHILGDGMLNLDPPDISMNVYEFFGEIDR